MYSHVCTHTAAADMRKYKYTPVYTHSRCRRTISLYISIHMFICIHKYTNTRIHT